jgi:hypothetical protein
MSIDESRKNSRLFRDFLFSIDPNTCKAKYFNYRLPLNNQAVLCVLAFAEILSRHVFVKNTIRRIARITKAFRQLLHPSTEEMNALKNIRKELIDLLDDSKPIRNFFHNPDLPALILGENDINGLERLRIIFAYLDRATRWYAMLGVKSTAAHAGWHG